MLLKVSKVLKKQTFDGCYSISGNNLLGNSNYAKPSDLDEVPSPF